MDQARIALADSMASLQEVEGKKKELKAEIAQLEKPHKEVVRKSLEMLRTGFDEGTAWCRVEIDAVTRTIRFVKETSRWNADTQRDEVHDEVFDTLSFDDVDEPQLTLWQQEAEE
jgi:hypothetical protein